jgi:hypothetical protein
MLAIATLPYLHPKLHAVAVQTPASPNPIYVEQINIVSVPSGKHLTAEEAAVPVVHVIDVENDQIVDVVPEVLS